MSSTFVPRKNADVDLLIAERTVCAIRKGDAMAASECHKGGSIKAVVITCSDVSFYARSCDDPFPEKSVWHVTNIWKLMLAYMKRGYCPMYHGTKKYRIAGAKSPNPER